MSPHFRSALIAAALAGAPAIAMADLSQTDRDFIEQAAMGGHEEVSAGQSAAEGDNSAVAAFGRQMVEDHTKMNDELASIAKSKGVTPPDSASLMQQAKTAATGILPGATFDRTYINTQVEDHKTTLELLQNEAANGNDPDLKAFAQKYVPMIQEHLTEAENVQQQLGQD
ncbi:MAG: DUF4142 domain-containing protein [Geminicoccaceae bacterium]